MKKVKLIIYFILAMLTAQSWASIDYKIYSDIKGMPRCFEMNNGGPRLLIVWNQFTNLQNRDVYYHQFKSGFKSVCKNWNNYDYAVVKFDVVKIDFDNGSAPDNLEGFTLDPKTKRALEQISVGINRFIPNDGYRNPKFLKEIFEPFKIETYQNLMRELGANITTELYHGYTNVKGISSDCEKLIGTCEYYLCREKNKACGSEGYFLGFGYQYCSDSMSRLFNEVSPVGKKWLKTTATCLQQQVEEVKSSSSCSAIKKEAIASHDKCYSEVSFCSLKLNDILKIMHMIYPALTEQGVLAEGMQVLGHCTGN